MQPNYGPYTPPPQYQPQGQQPQPQYPFPGMPQQPKRNPVLLGIGVLLVIIGLVAGILFAMNLYQYLTVEDRWANDSSLIPEARRFGVRLIQAAAMRKMTIFGPVAGVFWIGGLVMLVLGLRKK